MAAPRNTHSGYEDIEEIVDPDGVVGVISRRRYNGALSLAIFKVFERDGIKERTNFLSSRHLAAAQRVIGIAQGRMAELEADNGARP